MERGAVSVEERMRMYEVAAELTPRAPFDFGQSLAFLRGFPLMRGDQAITDDSVTRAVVVAGETVVFRVVGQGTVDNPMLSVALYTDMPILDVEQEEALDRIAFFLSIADDLAPLYALGREDAAFAPVIAHYTAIIRSSSSPRLITRRGRSSHSARRWQRRARRGTR